MLETIKKIADQQKDELRKKNVKKKKELNLSNIKLKLE